MQTIKQKEGQSQTPELALSEVSAGFFVGNNGLDIGSNRDLEQIKKEYNEKLPFCEKDKQITIRSVVTKLFGSQASDKKVNTACLSLHNLTQRDINYQFSVLTSSKTLSVLTQIFNRTNITDVLQELKVGKLGNDIASFGNLENYVNSLGDGKNGLAQKLIELSKIKLTSNVDPITGEEFKEPKAIKMAFYEFDIRGLFSVNKKGEEIGLEDPKVLGDLLVSSCKLCLERTINQLIEENNNNLEIKSLLQSILIGRTGGDEFAGILISTSEQNEYVLNLVKERFDIEAKKINETLPEGFQIGFKCNAIVVDGEDLFGIKNSVKRFKRNTENFPIIDLMYILSQGSVPHNVVGTPHYTTNEAKKANIESTALKLATTLDTRLTFENIDKILYDCRLSYRGKDIDNLISQINQKLEAIQNPLNITLIQDYQEIAENKIQDLIRLKDCFEIIKSSPHFRDLMIRIIHEGKSNQEIENILVDFIKEYVSPSFDPVLSVLLNRNIAESIKNNEFKTTIRYSTDIKPVNNTLSQVDGNECIKDIFVDELAYLYTIAYKLNNPATTITKEVLKNFINIHLKQGKRINQILVYLDELCNFNQQNQENGSQTAQVRLSEFLSFSKSGPDLIISILNGKNKDEILFINHISKEISKRKTKSFQHIYNSKTSHVSIATPVGISIHQHTTVTDRSPERTLSTLRMMSELNRNMLIFKLVHNLSSMVDSGGEQIMNAYLNTRTDTAIIANPEVLYTLKALAPDNNRSPFLILKLFENFSVDGINFNEAYSKLFIIVSKIFWHLKESKGQSINEVNEKTRLLIDEFINLISELTTGKADPNILNQILNDNQESDNNDISLSIAKSRLKNSLNLKLLVGQIHLQNIKYLEFFTIYLLLNIFPIRASSSGVVNNENTFTIMKNLQELYNSSYAESNSNRLKPLA
jgi:hypothetical protein